MPFSSLMMMMWCKLSSLSWWWDNESYQVRSDESYQVWVDDGIMKVIKLEVLKIILEEDDVELKVIKEKIML